MRNNKILSAKSKVEKFTPGPAPGDENPRWPDAPEPGPGVETYEGCKMCGEPSTLSYRCSECGYDMVEK